MAYLGAPKVSRREKLAIVDRGEAVRLHPLSVAPREIVDEQKLVGALHAVHWNNKSASAKLNQVSTCNTH